jgi:hypothetical protein
LLPRLIGKQQASWPSARRALSLADPRVAMAAVCIAARLPGPIVGAVVMPPVVSFVEQARRSVQPPRIRDAS